MDLKKWNYFSRIDFKNYLYTCREILIGGDGLSYIVRKGAYVDIVGESACCKNASTMSFFRLKQHTLRDI